MILAAMSFTALASSVKIVTKTLPIFEVTLTRGFFGGIITLCVAKASGVKPLFGHPRRAPLMALRAFFGVTAMSLSYFGLYYLTVHEYTALFFSNPAFTSIMAWLILGEQLTWLTFLGTGIALAGLPVLTRPPFLFGGVEQWTRDTLVGVSMALTAAVLAGGRFTVKAVKGWAIAVKWQLDRIGELQG